MNKFSDILDTCKLAINVHYPDAVLSIYTNKKRGIVRAVKAWHDGGMITEAYEVPMSAEEYCHLRKNLRYMQHDESTGIMCYTIFR